MEYKVINKNNYNLHLINTTKFKQIEIDIKFQTPANKDIITYRSLLPYVLRASTKKYPSKKKINEYLEELYGASLYVSSSKQGLSSFMNFSLKFVNEEYLDNSKGLIKEALEFLNEIIFNPNINNDSFNDDVVKEEKRLLMDEFASLSENKGRYAYIKMLENMYKNDIYSVMSIGIKDEVSKINSKNLYQYYLKTLQEDCVDIIISGNVNESIEGLIDSIFNFKNKVYKKEIIDYSDNEIKEVKRINDYQDIAQGKLVLGYRTFVRNQMELHYPMVLASAILGGYPHSKLFMNVREKASLAYSVYTRHDSLKGLLAIQAGIDTNKLDLALKIIYEQVDDMKKGNITDEEIQTTKKALVNDFLESLDSQNGINQKAYNDLMLGRDFNPDCIIEKINKVTKDEIIKASSLLKLDTIYFLGSDRK